MTRILRGALALSLLGLLISWAVLWRFTRGNVTAIAGAFASFVAMTCISGWYQLAILKWRPDDDQPPNVEAVRTRDRLLYWPVLLLGGPLPGVWIGLTARTPLPIAIGYWLTREAIVCLPFLLPPPPPEELRPRHLRLEPFLHSLVRVLAPAALGALIRASLRL